MKPIGSLLTVKEAAARLTQLRGTKVTTQAVYRMVNAKAHRLPTIRAGKRVYVADLDGWLAAQAAASIATPEASTPPETAPPAVRVRRRGSKSAKARSGKRNPFGTPAPVTRFPQERRVG